MVKLLRYIALGVVFAALPGEVSLQALVKHSPHSLLVTLSNYVWFLAIAYGVGRWLLRISASPRTARIRLFVPYGLVGLSIEWFLLGVYPLLPNPVQLLLFAFWAGMATMPAIFTDNVPGSEIRQLRRAMVWYWVAWNAVALGPFVVSRILSAGAHEHARAFALAMFGLGVWGVYYFAWRYFRILGRRPIQEVA